MNETELDPIARIAACKAYDRHLFSDDESVAHEAASPIRVDLARYYAERKVTGTIEAYLAARPASTGEPGTVLSSYDIDEVDLDMIQRGDMLGRRLGPKVYAALQALAASEAARVKAEAELSQKTQQLTERAEATHAERDIWEKAAGQMTVRAEGLEDQLERTERNRDMWKGQCERQAAALATMQAERDEARRLHAILAEDYEEYAAKAEARVHELEEGLGNAASLLEVIAEDAKKAGDIATWSMADVMARNSRSLGEKPSHALLEPKT